MDYTKSEVANILNRSEKTISRYIKDGLLHPIKMKGASGQEAYFFKSVEVDKLKEGTKRGDKSKIKSKGKNHTKGDTVDRNDNNKDWTKRGQRLDKEGTKGGQRVDINQEVLGMLQDTINILKDELKAKNQQLSDARSHSKDLMNSLQFAQQENLQLRNFLALPSGTDLKKTDIVEVERVDKDWTKTGQKEGTKTGQRGNKKGRQNLNSKGKGSRFINWLLGR